MVHSLHLFSKEENCVKGSAWLWWTHCIKVHIFYLLFIKLAVFILKECKFEAVFFVVEARGWSLQLSLLPMHIHITFSCAWKIRVLCNNLEIKWFCPWCINCDIHPGFSSWFWPVPWDTFKNSLAPVDMNGTLWEICVHMYAVVLHSTSGCRRDGQGHFCRSPECFVLG